MQGLYSKRAKRDGLLIGAGILCIPLLLYGCGTLMFFYEPVHVSRLFWFGPFITVGMFLLVFISRRLLEWGIGVALVTNYLGSLSAMALDCSAPGRCFAFRSSFLMKAQISILAVFTPQMVLSITIASFVFVSNRNARRRESRFE